LTFSKFETILSKKKEVIFLIMFIGLCKIWRTGNSAGITIPSKICKALNISKGDNVKMYYHETEKKIEIFLK